MSNNLRTRNGMPFNFVNGLKVRGMDIESLIPGIEGIPEAGSKYQFAGDGTNKLFTLPVSPYNKDAVDVYVKQLYVHPDDYTLVGDTVTLVEAPPAVVAGETYNVVIKVSLTTLNGYVNANRVSFEGENLDDILEKGKPLANYSNLRAYAGAATQVRITDSGIAGFFYYDAADTASVDNGGTVIVSANGKRWKRLFDGAVNVKWFGAKGDKDTDDTLAIQSMLNASDNNWRMYFPPGYYKVSSGLTMSATKNWQKIEGASPPFGSAGADSGATTQSQIVFVGIPGGAVGIITNTYCTIENLGITGARASVGGTTIGIRSESEINLNNVAISNWDTGMFVKTCYYSKLNNVNFRYNALALSVERCFTLAIRSISINGGRLEGQPTGNGVYITASQVNFYGGSIETYYGSDGYAIKEAGNSNTVNLDGVYFEPYGDETKIAPAAIHASGRGFTLNIRNCVAYVYYQETFVKIDINAYNFTLTSKGNHFKSSAPYTSTIYTLPTSADQLKSCNIDICDDNIYDCSTLPVYTSPPLPSPTLSLSGCSVKPPASLYGSTNTDHSFIGRPQVNLVLGTPPVNPSKGVIYWANGTTWNPFKSQFKPYPVTYDGSDFKQFVRPAFLSIANNNNVTLLPNENVLCITNTAPVTVYCPLVPADGDTHTIKSNGGSNAVTISGNGIAFENSASTYVLAGGTYQSVTLTFSLYINRWVVVSKVA